MNKVTALRGQTLSFSGDAFEKGLDDTMVYESDGLVVIEGGYITQAGPAAEILASLPSDAVIENYGENHIIMPGFIDCHVHYPQTQIIGAYGKQLIDWLNEYTFIAEQQFADKTHAKEVAQVFLQECLKAGTTTSSVFCTVHPQSVDAFFEASSALNMRMIAGKVLMDRNAPQALLDTPQQGYDESKALIARWHDNGRQQYAVTPRFAPTSSPEQMDMTGQLWQESPGTFLQSHVSENKGEIEWVKSLYPECNGYLDVYDKFQQLGPRAIYGHGVWLSESELQRCYDTGTALAHCPTSNQFLGSGLFDLQNATKGDRPVRVGLATDLGAGTSFSILQTLNETYKVAQLNGFPLSAGHAFYLATRGTAKSLYLDEKIGSLEPGKEADLVVINTQSTTAIEYRMKYCESIEEALFIQMTLGDDRAVEATYVAGKCLYKSCS